MKVYLRPQLPRIKRPQRHQAIRRIHTVLASTLVVEIGRCTFELAS